MSKFDFMKKYIQNSDKEDFKGKKHVFFRIEEEAIKKSEKKMGQKFPKELRLFYKAIGCGFMCNQDFEMFDRLMGPNSVADFYTATGQFVYNPILEHFLETNQFVFFEVSEDTFISIDITKQNEKGESPICYFGIEIAPSLASFLKRMENETDYYLEYAE